MSGSAGVTAGLNPVLYALYTLCSVAGLILLKSRLVPARDALRGGAVLHADVVLAALGAGCYASSFLVWLVIVSRLELSVAYPVAIGLTLVCSTLGAVVFLGEVITIGRLFGIAVVFVGMWIITRT